MKIDKRIYALALMMMLGMLASTSHAAIIDIDGRLANSTEASDLEWGDNSSLGDRVTVPPNAVDDDGTVTLTVGATIQRWRTGYSEGSYDAGEELNICSESSATTAAAAFSSGSYLTITLDSTGNDSDVFSWDSISASIWRNGSGADSTFQFAIDADNNGFTEADLVGTAGVLGTGTANAGTITYNGTALVDSATTAEVRLYTWGSSNAGGNYHLYDVAASYSIPEPATLGLVGLFGGGLLFVRRRFMM